MSLSDSVIRSRLRPLYHPPLPVARQAVAGIAHALAVVLCVVAWLDGLWPAAAALWIAIAWMDHAALTRLHEAAHRTLARSRFANEAIGIAIGTFALTPLSVYRYVHGKHHVHLGREADPEFWPYNLPGSSRAMRRTYAALELTLGWIFTPALYSLRTARAWDRLSPRVRRRLVGEWAGMILFWTAVVVVVDLTGNWTWLVVGHVVPAWLAGSLQTVRKFTEHLGRFGESIPEMTRTVVYRGPLGRAASASQLHVDHHGTHHRWPRVPYDNLPLATPIVYEGAADGMIFPNHGAAILDMLPHLLDPRVGPQWTEAARSLATSVAEADRARR